jgi:hypothetical protein
MPDSHSVTGWVFVIDRLYWGDNTLRIVAVSYIQFIVLLIEETGIML